MIEKKFKRLPCGISNFERLISENYCYVDKTRFIEVLENEANKNQFFIRPRKFGKTLFFSMLGHYYDINSAKNFDKLFGDLYIGKHPTPLRNSYLVMKFNFSGMDTSAPEKFTFDFNRKIINTVLNFFTDYRNLIPDFDLRLQEVKALNSGSNVMEIAYMATKSIEQKIFIIIDEYDHFANDLIAMGKNMGEEFHKTMIQANGLVRDFYETLKIATESVLNRIFITGISPVMLDDLTSGFNIVDNLTLKQKYNEMLGFTQQEVDALMVATGVEPSLINVDMKAYFDGYLFNENGANRVYNPSMILYFFNQLLDEGRKPQNIIDDNLQTDYGRLRRLTQNERNRELLIQIVKDNGIASKIIRKFSIDTLNSDDYFISLLFYMGLLTIKGPYLSQVMLGIPNYAIKTVYWEYISCLVQETSPRWKHTICLPPFPTWLSKATCTRTSTMFRRTLSANCRIGI
jgi:hypothetical protein